MEFRRTNYGIKYGKAEIRCFCSDKRYGTVGLVTPKTDGAITITFSPSGNVYIHHNNKEILAITKKQPTNSKDDV